MILIMTIILTTEKAVPAFYSICLSLEFACLIKLNALLFSVAIYYSGKKIDT
jgi:hypothetical protein